jgi:hypothetical protein
LEEKQEVFKLFRKGAEKEAIELRKGSEILLADVQRAELL